ncbi:MAG: 16S rRNA (adenine(1518)-N(6)/adenine(1519)-N(6))-dimethyltransferase RsmA [Alphaproteobacteria bacterium]|nr:16S rRNA (adenine(1518)-N(6)/adenine(1519)-N(6))-dimethyltransferase RsmA [Alphaproteobacteria bacterium]
MTEDGLPPLREVIAAHGLAAKKSLGQNFLFDLNLTRRIARAAGDLRDCTVVEIGPGPGGLTRALLMEGAKRVIAVERDERTLPALAEISAAYPGRLEVISADALDVDWPKLIDGSAKIVANLPYNVATALLLGWIGVDQWPPWFSSLTLMFQKEVAMRIVAKPGTEHYGRLSIISQWRCVATKLFDVNRSAFTPPPKITSSIVHLVPRAVCEPVCDIRALERVTAAGFGQRRKMLRSSLKAVFDDPVAVLESLGLDPQKRAEELSVADFARLAQVTV